MSVTIPAEYSCNFETGRDLISFSLVRISPSLVSQFLTGPGEYYHLKSQWTNSLLWLGVMMLSCPMSSVIPLTEFYPLLKIGQRYHLVDGHVKCWGTNLGDHPCRPLIDYFPLITHNGWLSVSRTIIKFKFSTCTLENLHTFVEAVNWLSSNIDSVCIGLYKLLTVSVRTSYLLAFLFGRSSVWIAQ